MCYSFLTEIFSLQFKLILISYHFESHTKQFELKTIHQILLLFQCVILQFVRFHFVFVYDNLIKFPYILNSIIHDVCVMLEICLEYLGGMVLFFCFCFVYKIIFMFNQMLPHNIFWGVRKWMIQIKMRTLWVFYLFHFIFLHIYLRDFPMKMMNQIICFSMKYFTQNIMKFYKFSRFFY